MDTISILRQSDAAIRVVTIGDGVEYLPCHTTGAGIALQVRKEMGNEAKVAAAVALNGDRWGLVLGRGLVRVQAAEVGKVHVTLLTPEVRLLHIGQLHSGRSNSRLLGGVLDNVLLTTDMVGEVECNIVDLPTCLTFVGLISVATVCASVTCKGLERGESFAANCDAVLRAVGTKAVRCAFLVVVSGSRVNEKLQAGWTGVMNDSQVTVASVNAREME